MNTEVQTASLNNVRFCQQITWVIYLWRCNVFIPDSVAQWKCNHCEFCTPGSAVKTVFSVIQSDLDQLDYAETGAEALEKREALCRKYRSVLHPKHAFLTNLRCSLSQLYGHVRGYSLEDLPDILLERKIEICKDVLSVADIIEPGLSRLRGQSCCSYPPPAPWLRTLWNGRVCVKFHVAICVTIVCTNPTYG